MTPEFPLASPRSLPSVTVYSKERCTQCASVKRWLLERDIPFTVERATEPDNLAALMSLGYAQAPVTFVTPAPAEVHFSGFRLDLLEQLFPAESFPRRRSLSPAEVGELAPLPPVRDGANAEGVAA